MKIGWPGRMHELEEFLGTSDVEVLRREQALQDEYIAAMGAIEMAARDCLLAPHPTSSELYVKLRVALDAIMPVRQRLIEAINVRLGTVV